MKNNTIINAIIEEVAELIANGKVKLVGELAISDKNVGQVYRFINGQYKSVKIKSGKLIRVNNAVEAKSSETVTAESTSTEPVEAEEKPAEVEAVTEPVEIEEKTDEAIVVESNSDEPVTEYEEVDPYFGAILYVKTADPIAVESVSAAEPNPEVKTAEHIADEAKSVESAVVEVKPAETVDVEANHTESVETIEIEAKPESVSVESNHDSKPVESVAVESTSAESAAVEADTAETIKIEVLSDEESDALENAHVVTRQDFLPRNTNFRADATGKRPLFVIDPTFCYCFAAMQPSNNRKAGYTYTFDVYFNRKEVNGKYGIRIVHGDTYVKPSKPKFIFGSDGITAEAVEKYEEEDLAYYSKYVRTFVLSKVDREVEMLNGKTGSPDMGIQFFQ